MNKILPLLFISSAVAAQVTVSHTDFTPIGRSFIMAFDTVARHPGSPGASQVWNFSNLQSAFLDTVLVKHPDSTPYSGHFPSANVSFGSPSAAYYQYFNNCDTAFYLLGMAVVTAPNPPSVSYFVPKSKYFQWPMKYLDSFSDSCIYISTYPAVGPNGTDTSKYISHYTENSSVDGWGRITIPMGTFNCLRQRKTQSRIDSSWYFSAQTGTWSFMSAFSDSNIFYDWVSNDPATGFILAEIGYNQGSNTYSGVYYMKDVLMGNSEYIDTPAILVYPNPASDMLYIQINSPGVLEICDMAGRLLERRVTTAGTQAMPVAGLAEGIYLLTFTDDSNSFLPVKSKVIIER